MKSAQLVEIGKQSFHIDTDAYKMLGDYLKVIEKHYKEEVEIYDDIERSVAEKLTAQMTGSQNVVTTNEVEMTISQLGTIEDITGEPESVKSSKASSSETKGRIKRRLFLDSDNAEVGGVAAGLAAYFDIDVVVVRILFVILAFVTSGFAVLVYLILWAVLKDAVTIEEQQQLRGEGGTIKDIEASVKSKATKLKDEHGSTISRLLSDGVDLTSKLIRISSRIFGVLVLLVGAGMFAAIIAGATTALFGSHDGSSSDIAIISDWLDIADAAYFVIFGSFVVAAISMAVFIIYTGISLTLLKFRMGGAVLLTLLAIFIMSLATGGALVAVNNERIEKDINAIENKYYSEPSSKKDRINLDSFDEVVVSDQISAKILEGGDHAIDISDADVAWSVSDNKLRLEAPSANFQFCFFTCDRQEVVVITPSLNKLRVEDQTSVIIDSDFNISEVDAEDQSFVEIYKGEYEQAMQLRASDQSNITLACVDASRVNILIDDQASIDTSSCRISEFYVNDVEALNSQDSYKAYPGKYDF